MDLTGELWAALTPVERTRTAKTLAGELPHGFAFDRVRTCQLGTRKNAVAFFTRGEARFVLAPGGRVRIGFDARRWTPTTDEQEGWAFAKSEYRLRGTARQHVARVTRRPKAVKVPALLVETTAGEVGWEPVKLSDSAVREMLRQGRGASRMTRYSDDGSCLRVVCGADGTVTAARGQARTHAGLSALLKKDGFRFPTVDEWEHLCGAGAETLFRWGDHAPCDRYPVGKPGRWNLHRRPNAFGLTIASDPYKFELTATTGTTRGGDGGHYACGGAGFFISWLTLATAYFEPDTCEHTRSAPVDPDSTVGRRVLELS